MFFICYYNEFRSKRLGNRNIFRQAKTRCVEKLDVVLSKIKGQLFFIAALLCKKDLF